MSPLPTTNAMASHPPAPISEFFHPFSSWRCPHCLRSYTPPRAAPRTTSNDNDDDDDEEGAPTIVFLRGTCRHDVCVSCIAASASSSSSSDRHRGSRLVGTREATAALGRRGTSTRSARRHRDCGPSSSSIVELPCPIDRCGGTFVADASKLAGCAVGRRSTADREVIDLCCDDEIVLVDDEDARGAAKREAEEEWGEGGEERRSSSPPSAAADHRPAGVKRESDPSRGRDVARVEDVEQAPPPDAVRSTNPSSSPVAAAAARATTARLRQSYISNRHNVNEEKRPPPEAVRSTDPSSSSPPVQAASRSRQCDASIRHVAEPPTAIWQDTRNLKPVFQVGDEVYAAWWDPGLDAKNGTNASWFPGKIESRKIGRRRAGSPPSRYGPTRLYRIRYDDGDELDDLEDYWVCSKRDYELSRKCDDMGWKPIGVAERFDEGSDDEWARMVGWYVVNVDGEERSFSFLEDAMKAHDACVIREHGTRTKRSYLNLPELHPRLFESGGSRGTVEGSERDASGVAGGSANVVVSPMSESRGAECDPENVSITTESADIASPKIPSSIKSEPKPKLEISDEGAASSTSALNVVTPTSRPSVGIERDASINRVDVVGNQSDEESRFSEVDGSDESEEDVEEWREVKRRRLDFSPEENALSAAFWAVGHDDVQFTEEAFLTKSLFHLNSFVNGKLKRNSAFSLFLREGIATPGFYPLPETIEIDRIAGMTHSQLKDALVRGNCEEGASQTAMWLKDASVGSFIMMRHEYPKCKFCPQRLKNDRGEYIGPVYVIGIITKKIVPWSAEERDISDNKTAEFSKHHWGMHNICRVKWRRMGLKTSLKDSTQNYINHICQPTLQRICHDFAKTSHQEIRRDLWTNATIRIRSNDFPERFQHAPPTTAYPADHGHVGYAKLLEIVKSNHQAALQPSGPTVPTELPEGRSSDATEPRP